MLLKVKTMKKAIKITTFTTDEVLMPLKE
jgi:hypothetical protein